MTPKRTVKNLLPPGAKLLYLVRVGSKAYGLDLPGSDDDYRGVFLPGMLGMLGFDDRDEVHSNAHPNTDIVLMSLKKFIRLALKGNPNVLEWLFVRPVDRLFTSPLFHPILRRKKLLLSKRITYPFSGYAHSQFVKIGREMNAGKPAVHCLRLLQQAIEVLRCGTLHVRVPEPSRTFLRNVRRGLVEMAEVTAAYRRMRKEMDAALESCKLPDMPPEKEFERVVVDIQLRILRRPKNEPVSDDILFQLADGFRRGEPCIGVADTLGMDRNVAREMLIELGIDTHRWANPFKREARVRKVVEALRGGMTLEALGRKMRLTRERVRQIAKMGGITSVRAERKRLLREKGK